MCRLITMRGSNLLLTVAIAALALAVAPTATAQHAGLKLQVEGVKHGPVPGYGHETLAPQGTAGHESLQPMETPIESILYGGDHSWVKGNPNLDLYDLDLQWGAAEGLTVKRNVSQQRVTAKGRPFDTGIQETRTNTLEVSPFTGMSFSLSERRAETFDLADISLGATEVQTMALHGDYGGGETTGKIDYSRKVTQNLAATGDDPFAPLDLTQTKTEEQLTVNQSIGQLLGGSGSVQYVRQVNTSQKPDEYPVEQKTETVKLDTGFWGGAHVNALLGASHANREAGTHWQKREFQISKDFGAGQAVVGFTDLAQRKQGATTDKKTQQYQLPLSIDGTKLALAYSADTTQVQEKLVAEHRTASFATQLAGYDIKGAWDRSLQHKGGRDIKTTTQSLQLPFNFLGEDASFTYNLQGTQADKHLQTKLRVAKVDLPLNALRQGMHFDYEIKGEKPKPNKPFIETRTAKLQVPMSVLDTPVRPQFTRITQRGPAGKSIRFTGDVQAPVTAFGKEIPMHHKYSALNAPGGSEQNQWRTDMQIPTGLGQFAVTRTATASIAPDGQERHTRVVDIKGPRVQLSPSMSATADWQFKDLPGGIDHHQTHVNIQTKPAPNMTVAADWRDIDHGPAKDRKQRQVDVTYDVSPRWTLSGRLMEAENLNQSPTLHRTMVVQHKPLEPEDLQVRAAFSSTDAPGSDGHPMKSIEGSIGDPTEFVGLKAKYQEYDEKKLEPLPEPIIGFHAEHKSEGSMNVAVGYEDSKNRPRPRREYRVVVPMGETALQLGLSQNILDPMDPKNKRIRIGDVYDWGITSTVFNDVALDLTLRHFESEQPTWDQQCTDQWMQMQLAGGKPQKGGKVKLVYKSGDFVQLVKKHPNQTPTSKLSLEYEKRWGGDDGKLTLQVHRTTMPNSIDSLKDSYEGRLKFDYRF